MMMFTRSPLHSVRAGCHLEIDGAHELVAELFVDQLLGGDVGPFQAIPRFNAFSRLNCS